MHHSRYSFGCVLALSALAAIAAPAGGASAAIRFRTLHAFCSASACADGTAPVAGLVRDGAGNLYGTAADFGAYNHGVVFELFWNGTKYKYKVLHNFCVDAAAGCADGANPWGGLIVDTNGNLYGTTQFGGSSSDAACQSTGCGVAFELVKASKYKFQKLYTFCSLANCADGENPVVGLTYTGAATGTPYDGTSALYGTATYGGLSGNGVAFQLTFVSGQYKRKWKVLNSFSGSDGSMPREMIADANGNIFGVANDRMETRRSGVS